MQPQASERTVAFLLSLRAQGVRDLTVLRAMERVPRERRTVALRRSGAAGRLGAAALRPDHDGPAYRCEPADGARHGGIRPRA